VPEPPTIIGPLITPVAVKLVDDRVKEAITKATLHAGGVFDGQIYQPTIVSNVPLDAALANEGTFGPVVVEIVDTPEQAVEAANRAMYGLTSSILAGDTHRAFQLAPKVLAGIVNINSPTVNDEIHAPMGGVRDSGWGCAGPGSLIRTSSGSTLTAASARIRFETHGPGFQHDPFRRMDTGSFGPSGKRSARRARFAGGPERGR
jgi:acyl-CoA reductase-like NAD-dependent aldehyde dehydrogenase